MCIGGNQPSQILLSKTFGQESNFLDADPLFFRHVNSKSALKFSIKSHLLPEGK